MDMRKRLILTGLFIATMATVTTCLTGKKKAPAPPAPAKTYMADSGVPQDMGECSALDFVLQGFPELGIPMYDTLYVGDDAMPIQYHFTCMEKGRKNGVRFYFRGNDTNKDLRISVRECSEFGIVRDSVAGTGFSETVTLQQKENRLWEMTYQLQDETRVFDRDIEPKKTTVAEDELLARMREMIIPQEADAPAEESQPPRPYDPNIFSL